MNIKVKLGDKLKQLRKQRKLTQEQLAELVSVDFRHISYLENGKSFPSSELIERLCKTLNVTYSELFSFDETISRAELLEKISNIIKSFDDKKLLYTFKMVSNL